MSAVLASVHKTCACPMFRLAYPSGLDVQMYVPCAQGTIGSDSDSMVDSAVVEV